MTPSAAQQSTEPGLVEQVQSAEALLKKGKAEAATRALYKASRRLRGEPAGLAATNLQEMVDGLLSEADPLQKNHAKAHQEAARILARHAQSYQRRKWNRVADRLLGEAATLSAEIVGGTPTKNAPKKADDGDLTPALRSNFGHRYTLGKVIKSPVLTKVQSAVFLSNTQMTEDGFVSIEVQRPDTPSVAALIFGGQTEGDYYLYELEYFKKEVLVIIYQWKRPELKVVGSKHIDLSKEVRADWVRYGLNVRGNRVDAFVNGEKIFSARCARIAHGKLGMMVSGNSKYRGQVKFRNLRLNPVRGASSSAPSAGGNSRLFEAVQDAEKLLAKKKLEAATLLLLDAQAGSHEMAPGKLRDSLTRSVIKLLKRADRYHSGYPRMRASAAAKLTKLATLYAEHEWFGMAADVLREAAALDPSAAAKARAKIEAKQKSGDAPGGR